MTYDLVIQFTDQSAPFVHGFKAGRVWQQMKNGTPVIKETVAHETAELYFQMAARNEYTLSLTNIGNGWMELRAEINNLEKPKAE